MHFTDSHRTQTTLRATQLLSAKGLSSLSNRVPRLHERFEEERFQQCEKAVQQVIEQEKLQRATLIYKKWHHVRAFYTEMSEYLIESNMRKMWVRYVADECHRGMVTPLLTPVQLQCAVNTALRMNLSSVALKSVMNTFQPLCFVLQHDKSGVLDYRELVCALLVLDRWQEGARKMLSLWFEEYACVYDDTINSVNSTRMGLQQCDLKRLLMTACSTQTDEMAMEPFVSSINKALVHREYRHSIIWIADLERYADTNTSLVELVQTLCWQRLPDDMRLDFYRNSYHQSSERVDKVTLHLRLQTAIRLWQLKEPRNRFGRWKAYTADRVLLRKGDKHYQVTSILKMLRRFLSHRQRKKDMRQLLVAAQHAQRLSLVRWTLGGWQLFWKSMNQLHVAAWKQSVRHHQQFLLRRMWKQCVVLLMDARRDQRHQQKRIDAFVSRRLYRELKKSWKDWIQYYQRSQEIRVAQHRERELHRDIEERRQEESERLLMNLEDEISQAVEVNVRREEEIVRRRAFQAASERVHQQRKVRQQDEERRVYKQARAVKEQIDFEQSWTRIGEKVEAEVRASSIIWVTTEEGKKAVHAEATILFERNPLDIQNTLLMNPQAGIVPGRQWQLQLDDNDKRSVKAYYVNTITFRKISCDDLAIEDCEEIAQDMMIHRRIDEAKERLRVQRAVVQRQQIEQQAALKIQSLFRCRHALIVVRNRIRVMFIKRIEPTTGDVVYYNMYKQETRRRPPRLIGKEEPSIPVESSTWVRRLDEDGQNYYQQLATGETSWTPPSHHMMCSKCKFNFATRRWNEAGARFCVVCYADGMKKDLFGINATWTKISIQPVKCMVCRNNLATVLCHECRGDVMCTSCSQIVHQAPKLTYHTQMDRMTFV